MCSAHTTSFKRGLAFELAQSQMSPPVNRHECKRPDPRFWRESRRFGVWALLDLNQ